MNMELTPIATQEALEGRSQLLYAKIKKIWQVRGNGVGWWDVVVYYVQVTPESKNVIYRAASRG
jgi:hypothetical protein